MSYDQDPLRILLDEEPVRVGANIKVIGVGGGGSNAVNRMVRTGFENVQFIVANTDAQALAGSPASSKVQLGRQLTKGLGAGADPRVGREAALEDTEKILEVLTGADLVFVGFSGEVDVGAPGAVAAHTPSAIEQDRGHRPDLVGSNTFGARVIDAVTMYGRPAIAQIAAGAARDDRLNLREDGQRDLVGRVGADVEAGGREQPRAVAGGAAGRAQDVFEQPRRSPARSENADVARGAGQKMRERATIVRGVVGRNDARRERVHLRGHQILKRGLAGARPRRKLARAEGAGTFVDDQDAIAEG